MDHALQCKKGRLIVVHHNGMADDWGALCAVALTPKYVAHKPLINYVGWSSMGKGGDQEETRVEGEWVEEREELEEGLGWLVLVRYGEAQVGTPSDVENDAPGEKYMHNFWRRGTACIFDIRVADSDATK